MPEVVSTAASDGRGFSAWLMNRDASSPWDQDALSPPSPSRVRLHGTVPRILTGSLVTFALPDLLQWLEVSRHSGRLAVRKAGTKRSIDFLRGSIVFVSSNRPGERLGTFLEARGILPRGTLFEALAENFLTGRNLTRVLLDRGHVSREALAAAVEELAVRILLDMFRWPRADFEFDPEAPTEDILHIRLSLHGQLLAMHGAKLVDDATRWADADEARAASSLPAPDGLDPEEVSRTFWSLLERIQTAPAIVDQWQLEKLALVTTRKHVLWHTPGLPPEYHHRLWGRSFATVESAIEALTSALPPGATIAVIPEGPYVLARSAS